MKPNPATSTQSSIPVVRSNTARKAFVYIKPDETQHQKIRDMSATRNPVLDYDNCQDLAAHIKEGKLGMDYQVASNDEIIVYANRAIADAKYVEFLDNAQDKDLLPGDAFLQRLLDANVAELETPAGLIEDIFGRLPPLPLTDFIQADANGDFDKFPQREYIYTEYLARQFQKEIDKVTKTSKLDAQSYIERIRRVLREKARHTYADSTKRDIWGAWEETARSKAQIGRRAFIILGLGSAATGLISILGWNSLNSQAREIQKKDGEISDKQKLVEAKQSELVQRRGLSPLNGDTVRPSTKQQILSMLDKTDTFYFSDFADTLITKINKDLTLNFSEENLLFGIGNINRKKIQASQHGDKVIFHIPIEVYKAINKEVSQLDDIEQRKEKLKLIIDEDTIIRERAKF